MTIEERNRMHLVYELTDSTGTHLLIVTDPFGEALFHPEKLIAPIKQSWPGAKAVRYVGLRDRVVETTVRGVRADARRAEHEKDVLAGAEYVECCERP